MTTPDDDDPDHDDHDHYEDEEGDDEDEYDDDGDDVDKLDDLRERLECESGRGWTEIGATLESLTVAMEIRGSGNFRDAVGCLVRVIAWAFEGSEEYRSTTWIPGITLADLQRGSALAVVDVVATNGDPEPGAT